MNIPRIGTFEWLMLMFACTGIVRKRIKKRTAACIRWPHERYREHFRRERKAERERRRA